MLKTIIVKKLGRVVHIQLNRPEALNALNTTVMKELIAEMELFDRNPSVGCFVLSGNEKAFAAGADISEMQSESYMDMFYEDFFAGWEYFSNLRTPKIAAVSGYALGGGCELAMMCDIIIASETATFGQPEIKLGVMPGMGGTQRLTRAIGKAKAMDLILTGGTISAKEAFEYGLISRVVPIEKLLPEAIAIATKISSFGKAAVMIAREAVDKASELPLREGLIFERRTFHALFGTDDQKEGMSAFIEKRNPDFKGR